MLESGEFTTIAELAAREGITPTYLARVLRLSLLSPEVVDAIMSGQQTSHISLAKLMDPFPLNWAEQETFWLSERQNPESE
jgi:ParB-like chromosome segregation protein Spo0J